MLYEFIKDYDNSNANRFFLKHYHLSPAIVLAQLEENVKTNNSSNNIVIDEIAILTQYLIDKHYTKFPSLGYTYTPLYDITHCDSNNFIIHAIIMALYNIKRYTLKNPYIYIEDYFKHYSYNKSYISVDGNTLDNDFKRFFNKFKKYWSYTAFDFKIDESDSKSLLISNFLMDLFDGEYNLQINLKYHRSPKAEVRAVQHHLENLDAAFRQLIDFNQIEDKCEKLLYYYKFEYVYGFSLLNNILHEINYRETEIAKLLTFDEVNIPLETGKEAKEKMPVDEVLVNNFLDLSALPNVLSRNNYLSYVYCEKDSLKHIHEEVIPIYENTFFILLATYYKNDYKKMSSDLETYIKNQLGDSNNKNLQSKSMGLRNCWSDINSIVETLDHLKDKDEKEYFLIDIFRNAKIPKNIHNLVNFVEYYQLLNLTYFFKCRYTEKWWITYSNPATNRNFFNFTGPLD